MKIVRRYMKWMDKWRRGINDASRLHYAGHFRHKGARVGYMFDNRLIYHAVKGSVLDWYKMPRTHHINARKWVNIQVYKTIMHPLRTATDICNKRVCFEILQKLRWRILPHEHWAEQSPNDVIIKLRILLYKRLEPVDLRVLLVFVFD